jgi:hypothetical protein
MRASLVATLAVALLASSPGFAADADFTNKCTVPTDAQGKPECLCSVPFRVLQESPVALLNYIKGEVLKSDKAGFTPVTGSSTTLQVGDTVLLKADAQAEVTAGNCSHVVGPQASLAVKQIDGPCACIALSGESSAAAAPAGNPGAAAAPAGNPGALLALGVIGAGAVGGIVLLAPRPASP